MYVQLSIQHQSGLSSDEVRGIKWGKRVGSGCPHSVSINEFIEVLIQTYFSATTPLKNPNQQFVCIARNAHIEDVGDHNRSFIMIT